MQRSFSLRARVQPRIGVLAGLCTAALAGGAAGDTQAADGTSSALAPGASTSDCRSALHPGPSSCRDAGTAVVLLAGPSADSAPRRQVSEPMIDAFLSQYGKPPREAVRALLDPSDDNIRAWLRSRRHTLDNASYVAQRMTALDAQRDSAGDLP